MCVIIYYRYEVEFGEVLLVAHLVLRFFVDGFAEGHVVDVELGAAADAEFDEDEAELLLVEEPAHFQLGEDAVELGAGHGAIVHAVVVLKYGVQLCTRAADVLGQAVHGHDVDRLHVRRQFVGVEVGGQFVVYRGSERVHFHAVAHVALHHVVAEAPVVYVVSLLARLILVRNDLALRLQQASVDQRLNDGITTK